MAAIADFIHEATTTSGTGTVTLTELDGFARMSDVFAVNDTVYYSIKDGNNRETGIGTVGTGNTLARTTVQATYVSSVYDDTSPTAITLSGNGAEVFISPTSFYIQTEIVGNIPTTTDDNGWRDKQVLTVQQGGAYSLDFSTDRTFLCYESVSSTMSFSFSNFEVTASLLANSSRDPEIHIFIKNGGAKTSITWPSWVNWDNDTAPAPANMQSSGWDHIIIAVISDRDIISSGQYYGYGRHAGSTSGTSTGGGV